MVISVRAGAADPTPPDGQLLLPQKQQKAKTGAKVGLLLCYPAVRTLAYTANLDVCCDLICCFPIKMVVLLLPRSPEHEQTDKTSR